MIVYEALYASSAYSRRIDVGTGSLEGFVDVGKETEACFVDLLCGFWLGFFFFYC